ncbi:MAG: hypothetical protein PUH77_08630, partial [Bacteroidales bacterium]|nr:hypothetical protein [Bacteroidales bacterium]MDY5443384.1 hypothetical protein [Candidatus Cryptobacteroides sp.]
VSITLSNGTYTLTMKRKQINRGKKWLVAVLPPTTFVTITNQKCQLYRFPYVTLLNPMMSPKIK